MEPKETDIKREMQWISSLCQYSTAFDEKDLRNIAINILAILEEQDIAIKSAKEEVFEDIRLCVKAGYTQFLMMEWNDWKRLKQKHLEPTQKDER